MNSTWQPFPQRVYNVLKLCEEQGREDIISWENNGSAFRVNDLEEFKRDLLPRYFNTKKYFTFTRALYAHGFACVRAGRQTGIYSHPSFNRNDPLSASLIKRVPKKKKKTNHDDDPNPSLEALNNNRHSSGIRSDILNVHPARKSPALAGKTECDIIDGDKSAATVFGRSYHTIPFQGAARVTSTLPLVQIPGPPGKESLGAGGTMNTRSYPDPNIPSTSSWTTKPAPFHTATNSYNANVDDGHIQWKPIFPNDSLFTLGRCHSMVPIVSPSGRAAMDGSELVSRISMIPCLDSGGHTWEQEQDDNMTQVHIPNDNDQQSNHHQPVIEVHTVSEIYDGAGDEDPRSDM